MSATRTFVAFAALAALLVLLTYPLVRITFPWTVPVPYLLAMMASIGAFIAAVCR